MAVRLNQRAYDHAQKLVREKAVVLDERDDWSEHRPSTQKENEFLKEHGFGEYGKWYLGIDDDQEDDKKGHYKFPFGDFAKVHRCGVISAEVRAAQRKYNDIETAVAHLHGMLEAMRDNLSPRS